MTLLSSYAGMLGGFAAVHDARRQAAEEARSLANAAMDRDLRSAGVTGFRLNGCWGAPSTCGDLRDRFSAETHARIQRYFDVAQRYHAWSDLGNVTGLGWTDAERRTFIAEASRGVVGALGQHAVQKLQDSNQSPSWEPFERPDALAQEYINEGAAARLDGFLSDMHERPGQTRTPEVEPPSHPAVGPEGERALQALADQGRNIDRLNEVPIQPRQDTPYADGFAARVDQESGRLEASAADSAAQGQEFQRAMERQEERTGAQLRAWRALIAPQRLPPPAPFHHQPPAAKTPGPAAEATPNPAGRADHCAAGAFKCPNGRPWPQCTHPEKYLCPPPEHAVEAARHRQSDKNSSDVMPKP
jgi:hypothetical protein